MSPPVTTTARPPSHEPAIASERACASVEAALVELFGEVCHWCGLPRSYGQIYGFVFSREQPVTFDDVFTHLGISKGSTSQGLRWLRGMRMIRAAAMDVEVEPGGHGRREHFTAVSDLQILLRVLIHERLSRRLAAGKSRLEKLSKALVRSETVSGDSASHLKRRLSQLSTWHAKVASFGPELLRLAKD